MTGKFDDLERLARMLDEEKITPAEYAQLKSELLADPAPQPSRQPGWYNDPTGKAQHQAYWDGHKWTGQTRSSQAQPKKWVPVNPVLGQPKSQPIYTKTWFWLLVGIFVLIVLGGMLGDRGSGTNTPTVDDGDNVGAYVVCQQFVEDRLVSPSSAEFGGPYSQVTRSLGGGRYEVDTYVDSENSFGAMIRTDFVCVVDHTSGDSYRLESLDIDE